MELVGRGGELRTLHHALDRSAAGRRTVVALRGEAGIGKTSLLTELRAEATRREATVLTTAVTDVETSIGWAGLATLLTGNEPAIEQLPSPQCTALLAAVGHGGGEQVEPLTVAAALAELLRRQAVQRPLVVIVDDVHWLDRASAGALSFAMRLHHDARTLFVLAARAEPIPLDLARLVDPATPDDLVVLEPAQLSVGAISELLHTRFGLQLGRIDLVRLHDLTVGNPLHVVETGRLLADGVPLSDALIPASLADVVDVQLRRFDPVNMSVLQAAALMPRIDLAQLAEVYSVDEVDAAVMQAESLGAVHVSGATLTFRHPLLQAGLARGVGSVERRALHHRFAALSNEAEMLAYHLSEAANGYDEAAATALDTAAAAATTRGLPMQAAQHARRAFELTDPTNHDDRSRRRLLAAEAALDGGDPRRTLDLLLPLAKDPALQGDQFAALSLIATATASVAGAAACVPWIQRLVDESPDDSEVHVRAQIMLSRAVLFDNITMAGLVAEQALASATTIGSVEAMDDAFAAQSVANFLAGQPVDFDRLASIASSRPSTHVNTTPSMVGEMLVWSDRLDEAVAVLDVELRAQESSGSVTGELDATSQLLDVKLRAGDLEAAAALTNRSLALANAAGFHNLVVLRLADRALITALRGDPDHGTESIEADRDGLSNSERTQLDAVLGYAALVSGDHASAARRLRAAHSLAARIGLADLGALPFFGNLVEALVAVGATDDASSIASSMAATAACAQRGRADAEALRARAMVLASIGDLVEAEITAARAIAAFETLPLPIERGRALLLAGGVARRRKQRARSGELLRAADALFVSTGAVAYSRRARAELDRLGLPSSHELTGTEAQIVDLVVAGRRNDEIAAELFITRRTVEANLTRVYRKLGVRSRTELAARVRGR